MCLLVCICYMSVGVYLIKMNIYNFACEIIVYIHRESQRDQHAVYVCCTLFAINFLDVDIHIYMTVWSIKLQCRIFFKIYGKLYVEHYFMCIIIYFFYRNQVDCIKHNFYDRVIVFLNDFFFLQFELTKNLSLQFIILLTFFGFFSKPKYVCNDCLVFKLVNNCCMSLKN